MQFTIDSSVVFSAISAATGAAAVALTVGVKVRRELKEWRDRAEEFWLDWQGVAPRPGVPGRDGVMQRLAGIEGRQAFVEGELRANGGTSVKDALKRVEARQAQIWAQLEQAHVIALTAAPPTEQTKTT